MANANDMPGQRARKAASASMKQERFLTVSLYPETIPRMPWIPAPAARPVAATGRVLAANAHPRARHAWMPRDHDRIGRLTADQYAKGRDMRPLS